MNDTRLSTVFLGFLSFIALGVLLKELQAVLLPFIIALFLFFIFKPVVLYLQARRLPMPLAILLVLLAVAGLMVLASLIISSSVQSFQIQAPKYAERLEGLVSGILSHLPNPDLFSEMFQVENWNELISVSSITTAFTAGLGTFVTFFSNVFLIVLYLLFLLAGSGQFQDKLKAGFSNNQARHFAEMASNVDAQIRHYVVAKIFISLGTGLLTTIILWLFGVDFALLWGFLTFLLNFIPNIGSILAALFPIVISLLQFDSLGIALVIALLLVSVQTVMGNVVEPKVMEARLNLSPVLILLSLIFWGWLWGVIGMVLAVPIMSTIKIVFANVAILRPLSVLMSGTVNVAEKPTLDIPKKPTLKTPEKNIEK